jgi:hypothetical protein
LFVEVEKNTVSVNGSSGAIPFQSYQLGWVFFPLQIVTVHLCRLK